MPGDLADALAVGAAVVEAPEVFGLARNGGDHRLVSPVRIRADHLALGRRLRVDHASADGGQVQSCVEGKPRTGQVRDLHIDIIGERPELLVEKY